LDKKELKYRILICALLLVGAVTGCAGSGGVKVYDGDSAGVDFSHNEVSMTAVVSGVNLDTDEMLFVDCVSGEEKTLLYNGGVTIKNAYGNDIDPANLSCGEIMDVTYYEDTGKLTDMTVSSKEVKRTGVSKFTLATDKKSASYKGVECSVSQYVTAYDDNIKIDLMEISTEDQVTLNFYGDKLMSIVVELGHGYVKLENQTSYIGGMVEIGYDVIVPVTSDMLLEVREGTYTLRISKNGYSQSKEGIEVVKGDKTEVDLLDIAIPRGTAVFNISPDGVEATVSVDGTEQPSHTYSNIYGDYTIKVEAEGYDTFSGKFTINDSVKEFNITLTEQTADDTDSTEETTEDSTTTTETTEASGSTSATTATSENVTTNSKITISTPEGAGVYVDGEYVGVAPVTFAKTVGTHTVTLYKSGYLIKSYTIQSLDDGNDDTYTLADLVPLSEDAEEAEKSTTESTTSTTTGQ
jgi:hypothetical protein